MSWFSALLVVVFVLIIFPFISVGDVHAELFILILHSSLSSCTVHCSSFALLVDARTAAVEALNLLRNVLRVVEVGVQSFHIYLSQSCLSIPGVVGLLTLAAWRSGNGVGRINEVTLCRARLVLGWVTCPGVHTWCG